MLKAVLFDLDGTFADTAPDLARALNAMREARALPPVSIRVTRPVTSLGARGMLGVGFDMAPEHAQYPAMREEFLALYAKNLCVETRVFPGMPDLLARLQEQGVKWGIVTNKAERFAKPLIRLMGFAEHCACVIGGDTTARTKPHPDPLLAACRELDIEASSCAYVGDDARDIEAGRAAGMKTIAVRYGYLNGGIPDAWGADAVVDFPEDILRHL